MNKITYKGKEYPIRTFRVQFPGTNIIDAIIIATMELWDDIEEEFPDKLDNISEEAKTVDEQIYFYVEDEAMLKLPAAEICSSFLDDELIFLEEIL